ncbi:MAG: serine/threonine protein kinase [Acidobacteriales bacterium]|nr:serine/threonine protein kinase [Terriglobales bacterium]
MAMMFGRFEIQSELSKSDTALIYKATDTETNQTVALKTQSLEPLGEGASAFVDTLIAEGENTRDLASQNIAVLYGAGEIEGEFCAAMEYVQGNSIATMLSRKEGFSIWDLVDITRQVCAGLDYAASKEVTHNSLEPAKIMVQWDGLVKILGYGISNMSLIGAESGNSLGRLLSYASPEQVRGDAIDLRSNLFTWGAVLYEMVTDRKAFDAEDPAALATQIASEMPPSPSSLNSKIQAGVSALIMKALAKDPEERYQSARELVDDLEKCKENGRKSAGADAKKAAAAKVPVAPAARAAAASKFVSSAPKAAEPELSDEWTPLPAAPRVTSPPPAPARESRAAAAAAGAGAGISRFGSDSGSRVIDDSAETPARARIAPDPVMSAAAAEQETETHSPGVAFDPIMSAPSPAASAGRSFSDMDELPPMKEPVFAPPPPPLPVPEVSEPSPLAQLRRKEERPKVQPREVAEKAIKEIKTVPPRLMIYSISGAVGLILIVMIALFFHVHSEDDDATAAPRPTKAASQPQPTTPAAAVPSAVPAEQSSAQIEEAQPEVTVRQIDRRGTNAGRKKTPAPAPVAKIPGQVQIDSTPAGAQIQLDGRTDPSWITPFSLSGLSPGQHTISVSKSGYSAEARTVDVASGSKSFVAVHLTAINALMVVHSTPAGAEVILDGKNTGRVTPAQFAVEKGAHTLVLRKQGFLDENTSADLGPGQNFQFAPALRVLGNADDIRSVGKFKKLFGGGGGDSVAGMGSMSVRTQPKGAQIAINRRLLEKLSPTEFMLGPGNYVVDITLTGFKPVHKVVSVEKGGKVAIDEILERE